MSTERDPDLDFVETSRLLAELIRRHECGLIMLERSDKSPDTVARYIRSWGNTQWQIGAAFTLMSHAKGNARRVWGDAHR